MTSRRELVTGAAARAAALLVGGLVAGGDRRLVLADPATPAASPVTGGSVPNGVLVNAADVPTNLPLIALMPSDVFAKGHLPGSTSVDWSQLDVTDTSDDSIAQWRRSSAFLISSLGIADPQRSIVVYDDGTLFAARLWWVMFYLGYAPARMIDGGMPAWVAAGGTPTTEIPEFQAPVENPVPDDAAIRNDALATKQDVLDMLGSSDTVLVDARDPGEYAAGHIPGAVNLDYRQNALETSPHFWKSADELLSTYAALGVTPDKTIVPYCSTGVRSAVTFFTLRWLGFPNVALYTGSWAEWSTDQAAPKQTGDKP